jgi:chloramphenicol-sensitive protein RarD
MTFLLAVFVFGEPLGPARVTTFALIWAAIALYFWDLRRSSYAAGTPGPA